MVWEEDKKSGDMNTKSPPRLVSLIKSCLMKSEHGRKTPLTKLLVKIQPQNSSKQKSTFAHPKWNSIRMNAPYKNTI
jgi:hypothetical protein